MKFLTKQLYFHVRIHWRWERYIIKLTIDHISDENNTSDRYIMAYAMDSWYKYNQVLKSFIPHYQTRVSIFITRRGCENSMYPPSSVAVFCFILCLSKGIQNPYKNVNNRIHSIYVSSEILFLRNVYEHMSFYARMYAYLRRVYKKITLSIHKQPLCFTQMVVFSVTLYGEIRSEYWSMHSVLFFRIRSFTIVSIRPEI